MEESQRIKIPNQIIPLFLGVLSVWAIFYFRNIQLTEITEGIIGMASLDGIDVVARNKISRNALLAFFGVQGIWLFIKSQLSSRQWLEREFYLDLKIFALLGSLGIFFLLIGHPIINTFNFLLTLFILRIFWAILRWFKPIGSFKFWQVILFPLALVLTLKLLPLGIILKFNDLLLGSGLISLGLLAFINQDRHSQLINIFFSVLPLSAFLGFELFQIGLQRGWNIHWALGFAIFGCGLFLWLWNRGNKLELEKTAETMRGKIPISIGAKEVNSGQQSALPEKQHFGRIEDLPNKFLILSLAIIGSIFHFYYGGINYPEDLFELANPGNSVHRLVNYGEWPFIDFLSSHLLSEQIPGYLYALFNGFDGSIDFVVYQRCFEYGFLGAIGYFFLQKIFDHRLFALGLVLLFPAYTILMPKAFCLALLSPLLIYGMWQHYTIRKLIFLGLWTIGLLFWKIDLGIANLVATLVCLILFYAEKRSGQLIRQGMKITGAGILLGLLVFGLIEVLTEGSLVLNLKKTLSYFSAEQAHGRSSVSYETGRLFRYHYFFFPALIALSIPYFAKELLQSKLKNQNLLWALAVLFLGIFILVNFPRGILRHSLIAGRDDYLTSFLYLFIPLLAGYFIKAHWRPISFIIIASLFIHNFKYKNPEKRESFFEQSYEELSNNKFFAKEFTKAPRISGGEEFKTKNYAELKNFLDQHFSTAATFLDLTNHPMLYFYTQRKVPAFFNQYLQNIANEELQLLNLEYLQQFDIPLVVYRSIPISWLDATDGIPNSLRYLEVHHYIQQHYDPFTVLDNREIWLKKDSAKPRGNFKPIPITEVQKFNFKKLPGLFDQKVLGSNLNQKTLSGQNSYWITSEDKSKNPQYLNIKLKEKSQHSTVTLKIKAGKKLQNELQFNPAEKTDFTFPISWIDGWMNRDSLQLQFEPQLPIETVSLLGK